MTAPAPHQVLVPHPVAATRGIAPRTPAIARVVHPVPGQRHHRVARRAGDVRIEPVPVQPERAGLKPGADHVHRMPVQADEPGPRYTRISRSAYRAVPRLLSQYRRFPRRSRYGPTIMSMVCRMPAMAASGTCGGSSPRFAGTAARPRSATTRSPAERTAPGCSSPAGRPGPDGRPAGTAAASSRTAPCTARTPDRAAHRQRPHQPTAPRPTLQSHHPPEPTSAPHVPGTWKTLVAAVVAYLEPRAAAGRRKQQTAAAAPARIRLRLGGAGSTASVPRDMNVFHELFLQLITGPEMVLKPVAAGKPADVVSGADG